MSRLDQLTATRAAAIHSSVLVSSDALPDIAGTRLRPDGTPIHDVNGDVLFWRTPLGGRDRGYVDIAADSAVGGVIMAVAPDAVWAPGELLAAATDAMGGPRADEVRFVAYSYPKLAVQFLRDGEELAMLELFTWNPVPPARERDKDEPPSNFDRWSFLDEQPARRRKANEVKVTRSITELLTVEPRLRHKEFVVERLDLRELIRPRTTTVDLHFSHRSTDHHTCFELRGQETDVWCVGASVQMLLDFYRYEYTQVRLAQELGLGTLTNPNGLPYSQVAHVVTVLQKMSGDALTAAMITNPTFSQFKAELRENRPMISFVPGHSRAVAGYTETTSIFTAASFQGLLVFDPWPPNAGVITQWENVATQTYQYAYSARVTLL